MSCSSNSVVANLWPVGLSQAIFPCHNQLDINANDILPSTLKGLVEYVELADNLEIRNLLSDLNPLWSVTARVHGFLDHTQLNTFDNWDGYVDPLQWQNRVECLASDLLQVLTAPFSTLSLPAELARQHGLRSSPPSI